MTQIKREPVISTSPSPETNKSIDSHQGQASSPLSSTNEELEKKEGSRGDSGKEKGPKGGN